MKVTPSVLTWLAIGVAASSASAETRHELAFRYRNLAQPTLLYDDAFGATDGRLAFYRSQPVFGVRLQEWGPGPLQGFARVVWAILFANQVKTQNFTNRPVYATTDVKGAATSYVSFDYGSQYMQFRLQTELNRFFGFRVGYWRNLELETDKQAASLPPTSPTAEFLRSNDATIASGRAGGEVLMLVQFPLHPSLAIGMELSPFSFLQLAGNETSEKLMRWMGYPRTYAKLVLPLGPASLQVTGLVPNKYWLVPWQFEAAEIDAELGIRF